MEATAAVRFTKRTLRTLVSDTAKSAAAINLVYVSDGDKGISRHKAGSSFIYKWEGKKIKDETLLLRIRQLVIPPAWQRVWICKEENGHLQVTGFDVMGRKQYKYHPLWTTIRNHTKFYHLFELGKALPVIRRQLEEDLALPGLPLQKVLALVVSVMQETGIRIGNSAYEKLYGSFGLSTLKDKHVHFEKGQAQFSFKGKKGVYQQLTLKSKKLTALIKKCRDIPGRELFQYYDDQGKRHAIDSGMVNEYLKYISGGHFTAKDFRTWTGTVRALIAFKALGSGSSAAEIKQRIVSVLDTVALHLGNTRAVCKKYYVHPVLLDLYECNGLEQYPDPLTTPVSHTATTGLLPEEELLMKILEKT